MSDKLIQRPNYFSGEALLTADFQSEQQYQMKMLRIANRSLHTYGIACGLTVTWQPESQQVAISPGVALDSFGRQIILVRKEILTLADIQAGQNYYLTIRYHEVYSDYTDETGVQGYKRIVEQPVIEYAASLNQPGIHILLAVINISETEPVKDRLDKFQRRYVGSTLGSLSFVAEGSGLEISFNNTPGALKNTLTMHLTEEVPNSISLHALQDNNEEYLSVEGYRTQFNGMLTTTGNAGVGMGGSLPTANLEVQSPKFEGEGILTSDGKQITVTGWKSSLFLSPGDTIITVPPPGKGKSQTRTICQANAKMHMVHVDSPFNPPLSEMPYTYIRSDLVRFALSSDEAYDVFRINTKGEVGIGLRASRNKGGNAGPYAISIDSGRRVGIGFNDARPLKSALEVDGDITAQALTLSGKVVAQSFEGNGSALKDLPILSYWTKENPSSEQSNLYYDSGHVGIQMKNPPASLSVGRKDSRTGSGLITLETDGKTVSGYQTLFMSEVQKGDILTIGTIIPLQASIVRIDSDTQLQMDAQFPYVINQSCPSNYSIVPAEPGNSAAQGTGRISTNGNIVIGNGTKFLSEAEVGQMIQIEAFKPAAKSSTWTVQEITDDTTLIIKTEVTEENPSEPIRKPTASAYQITSPWLTSVSAFSKEGAAPALLIRANVSDAEDGAEQDIFLHTVAISTSAENIDDGYALQVTGPVCFEGSVASEAEATAPPPALLITSSNAGNDMAAPHTIAINMDANDVDHHFALQVNGKVDFRTEIDTIKVTEIEATQSLEVGGTIAAGGNITSDAAIQGQSMMVGTETGDGSSTLYVDGSVTATGNITSDAAIQGQSMTVGTEDNNGALDVNGTVTVKSGSVQLLGQCQNIYIPPDEKNLEEDDHPNLSGRTETDGFLLVTVNADNNDAKWEMQITITVTPDGYKEFTLHGLAKYASTITLPVWKNSDWKVELVMNDTIFGGDDYRLYVYFIPFGTGTAQQETA